MAKRKGSFKDGIITCSRGRKRKTVIPFLPEEIIFNILIWLPAEFLHNHGKYVCRAWAEIIRDPVFIKRHLLCSNAKLLFQDSPFEAARFIEMKGEKVTMSNLNLELRGFILASCQGVLLFNYLKDGNRLRVTNPVTKQVVELYIPSAVQLYLRSYCRIAYISQTGKFKLTCPFIDSDGMCRWLVHTVGVDVSWRKIDSFTMLESWNSYDNGNGVSIDGVIYWLPNSVGRCLSLSYKCKEYRILAIDLVDECIHHVQLPGEVDLFRSVGMEMENNLSYLIWNYNSTDIDVWILKDLRRSEWIKTTFKLAVEIGGDRIWDRAPHPICWLENGRALVTWIDQKPRRYESFVVAYDVMTGAMRRIKKAYCDHLEEPHLRHISTLISW